MARSGMKNGGTEYFFFFIGLVDSRFLFLSGGWMLGGGGRWRVEMGKSRGSRELGVWG